MKKILVILLILALGIYLLYAGIQKRFYSTVLSERLIGIVKCAKASDKNYDFYLFYFPIMNKDASEFRFIKLKGGDWSFEGEIIKWKRPLNIMGFKTAHRPIQIYDSRGNSYPLKTRPEKIFFKIGKILPCVDASFISIAKQRVIPKTKFGIYATNSGYLIRKIR